MDIFAAVESRSDPSWSLVPVSVWTVESVFSILGEDLDGSRDWFRERFARWEGLPKRDIADYLTSQGILVPRRFWTFDEAVEQSDCFMIRSEDPREYAGMSWVYESYRVSCESRDMDGWIPLKMCMHIAHDLIRQYRENPACEEFIPQQGGIGDLTLENSFFTSHEEAEWQNQIVHRCVEYFLLISGVSQDLPLELSIQDRSVANRRPYGEESQDWDIVGISTNTLAPGWTSTSIIQPLGSWDISGLQAEYVQKVSGKKLSFQNSRGAFDIYTSWWWDAIQEHLKQYEVSRRKIDGVDRWGGIDSLKYSFWEYIPGTNLAVCRDNIDPEVYYIYRQGDSSKNRALQWSGILLHTDVGASQKTLLNTRSTCTILSYMNISHIYQHSILQIVQS